MENDKSFSEQIDTNIWHTAVDVNHLDLGIHSIHIQVKDTSKKWSVPLTRYFMKMSSANLYSCHYWFDNDSTTVYKKQCSNGIMTIDVENLIFQTC